MTASATYKFTTGVLGMQAIAATSATQQHPIGMTITAQSDLLGEGEFVYLKGLASTAVGEAVIYDTYANTTKRFVANDRGPVAIAMSANVANQYGWYQIRGAAVAKVAAGFAAGAKVYATATAGTVDDAVVAGDKVDGAIGKTAIDTPSTGFAVLALHYPCANGNG